MMDGAWNAKTLVTEYLAADLPSRLISFRNEWNYDDKKLPTPEKFLSFEPVALDHWPTIITLVTGTQGVQRIDFDEITSDPVYRVEYGMRTYIWVRHEHPEDTTEVRDNLTTVVRDALIDHPALRSVERGEHCDPYIDEGTIREEFSELTHVKGQRFLAGAYVGYNLMVNETVTRDLLTTTMLLDTNLTVEMIPKVPNAPSLLIAVAGDQEATLTWKAPTWDGGAKPVNGYRIEQTADSGDTWSTVIGDTGSITPLHTVTSLTNGTTYQFRVSGLNELGVGATSAASNPIVPST